MNRIILITVFFILLFLQPYSLKAQFTIQLIGGYNLPLPDFNGKFPDDANKNPYPYFQKYGFSFGVNGKWHITKERNIGITLSASYTMFSSGELNLEVAEVTQTFKFNLLQVGVGGEYTFFPKNKINPFIGAELTLNYFTGKTESSSAPARRSDSKLTPATRFGFNAGIGLDYTITRQIGIVIGSKYHIANLIGKDNNYSSTTNEYTLLDGEFNYETNTWKSRTISYLQFYAGVSFYLGKLFKKK